MRKKRAAQWGRGSALLVLVVGAVLPMWTTLSFSSFEIHGHHTPLWTALGRIPTTYRESSSLDQFWHWQESNLIVGTILLLLATGIGWGTYRILDCREPSPEARDFIEGSSGSLPDGR
jgi:hypothetical protein